VVSYIVNNTQSRTILRYDELQAEKRAFYLPHPTSPHFAQI